MSNRQRDEIEREMRRADVANGEPDALGPDDEPAAPGRDPKPGALAPDRDVPAERRADQPD